MILFRMRYLLFSLLVVSGCASDYKNLRAVPTDTSCISNLRPCRIAPSWYNASIEVMGRHVSGLLLLKVMPNQAERLVFINEAGIKFLDFEFLSREDFIVHYILPQLDKKPVIKLLKSDFALLLAHPFQSQPWHAWKDGERILYGVRQKNKTAYFITDKDCASLQGVESGSERKREVSVVYYGNSQQPDSVALQHHTFAMRIALKKLKKD